MAHSVLLVESDPDIASALVDLLEVEGHAVQHTSSGVSALETLASRTVDLVLLDLQTRELSGAAVLRVLQDLSVCAPVIAMSVYRTGWQRDAFHHGASACLPKPFDRRALLSLVECYGSRPGSSGSWPADVRELSRRDAEALRDMSPDDLDSLPFGIIRVDEQGRIDRYNRLESEASTFYPPSVLGLTFQELAPCTSVKEFSGAIQEGYAKGALDREMSFVFPHLGARALVTVRLWFDSVDRRVWIFVSKRRGKVPTPLVGDAAQETTIASIP